MTCAARILTLRPGTEGGAWIAITVLEGAPRMSPARFSLRQADFRGPGRRAQHQVTWGARIQRFVPCGRASPQLHWGKFGANALCRMFLPALSDLASDSALHRSGPTSKPQSETYAAYVRTTAAAKDDTAPITFPA
jgi:hypothetical protein